MEINSIRNTTLVITEVIVLKIQIMKIMIKYIFNYHKKE